MGRGLFVRLSPRPGAWLAGLLALLCVVAGLAGTAQGKNSNRDSGRRDAQPGGTHGSSARGRGNDRPQGERRAQGHARNDNSSQSGGAVQTDSNSSAGNGNGNGRGGGRSRRESGRGSTNAGGAQGTSAPTSSAAPVAAAAATPTAPVAPSPVGPASTPAPIAAPGGGAPTAATTPVAGRPASPALPARSAFSPLAPGGTIFSAPSTSGLFGAPATDASGAGRSPRPGAGRAAGPVPRTIRRAVEIVPPEVWAALGALATLALLLGLGSVLAARRARLLDRQRRELLDDVGLLQAALLPEVPGRVGAALTSAAYRPAEGPGAGGDFYDVLPLNDGAVAIVVGDVSGHGRAALPQTAMMRHTLSAYLKAGLGPRAAVQVAGAALDPQLGTADLATVVVAVWDPATRTLTYAPAGHPPPLILGAEHEPVVASSSPPIGAGLPTGMRQTRIHLPGPAIAYFYTDGVTDARREGRALGDEGLCRIAENLGPGASAEELLKRVTAATDERPDDMAACVLKLRGFGSVAPGREEELELRRDDLSTARPRRFLEACGVPPDEAAEVLREAGQTIGGVGAAVVRVSIDADGARADLHLSNVEVLPLAPERAEARAGRGA